MIRFTLHTLSILALTASCYGMDIVLAWESVPNVKGYWLYSGTSSHAYSTRDWKLTNSCDVPMPSITHYFAVSSMGTTESDLSDELKVLVVTLELQTSHNLSNWTTIYSVPYVVSATNPQSFFRVKLNTK